MNPPEPKMTRRDWFRLRKTIDESASLGSNASPLREDVRNPSASNPDLGSASTMQPIAHPPNHDGMDLAKLPPMREAQLALDEVLALLADIEMHGTEVQLLQRDRSTASRRESTSSEMAFQLAKQGITSGSIVRLQLRYSWQGSLWIDTLEARDASFRLVRIEHR